MAHGARPLRDANHESTPAGWANHAGNAAMRDYLLDHCPDGLDLVSFGRVEALRQYLAQHPDFATATLPDGGSPLHHLRDEIDQLDLVVAVLLDAGADLAARDARRETPYESASAVARRQSRPYSPAERRLPRRYAPLRVHSRIQAAMSR